MRALTRAGQGLRPKSLVVMLVMALAGAMGAHRVCAVRMKAHIFQARRYSKKKKACLQADYDELWQGSLAPSIRTPTSCGCNPWCASRWRGGRQEAGHVPASLRVARSAGAGDPPAVCPQLGVQCIDATRATRG